MATEKSKSLTWLTYHVSIYSLILFIGGFLYWDGQLIPTICFALINGVIHLVVDFITSRINKYLLLTKQLYKFFVVIGLDQLIHYTTLFITYKLLF